MSRSRNNQHRILPVALLLLLPVLFAPVTQGFTAFHHPNAVSRTLAPRKGPRVVLRHPDDEYSRMLDPWQSSLLNPRVAASRQFQFRPLLDARSPPHRRRNAYDETAWEGDDIRWMTRLWRRFVRGSSPLGRNQQQRQQPARNTLIVLNVVMYLYQALNGIYAIHQRHPSLWTQYSVPIVLDSIWGSAAPSPFTMDFVFSQSWSMKQPHRYVTSGFLHGGLVHLLLNMDALRRLPAWLETGLGRPLYLTTFLVSVVTGNLCHALLAIDSPAMTHALCLGASGGICGLYGLMYVSLVRMGNLTASNRVLKGMGMLLLYGLFMESISNAAHVGGFIGGLAVALLCGPSSYPKSYTLRRKWSLEVDPFFRDYRQVMGFGVRPAAGLLSLKAFWFVVVMVALWQPQWRTMPLLIWKGLRHPGSVRALV